MYSILTCADTNFYPMASYLARIIRMYTDCQLFLYDLGLTEKEKSSLKNMGVTIEKTLFDDDTFSMNSKGNIRTTHKINCIRHFLHKYKKGVIVLDADALPVENCIAEIFPTNNEIMVTYRCDREKKEHILINGKINAGVMGFGKEIEDDFFGKWEKFCEDKEQTDQSALSLLLEEKIDFKQINSRQSYGKYIVHTLDGNIYNDVSCRIGKIFHFKSAGRKRNKHIGFVLFALFQSLFPEKVSKLVELNRKHRWFVWRKKDI